MAQNIPKHHAAPVPTPSRPVLKRITRVLAHGAGALALSVPLGSEQAMAEGWQITSNYYSGSSIKTIRKLGRNNGGITELSIPAPANNCPGSAFEVMNPKPGEVRCLGYVAQWWWGRR